MEEKYKVIMVGDMFYLGRYESIAITRHFGFVTKISDAKLFGMSSSEITNIAKRCHGKICTIIMKVDES